MTPHHRSIVQPRGFRAFAVLVLMPLILAGSMAQVAPPDALEQARVLYNAGQYDEAIRLAAAASESPRWAQPAAVVIARSHLERFREDWQRADLVAARDALRTVAVTALEPRDRVEFYIALGESLYLDDDYSLDDRFGGAAEQFELAMQDAYVLDEPSRDRLFDWWAGSLDRQAQHGPQAERRKIYERILAKAELALRASEPSIAPSYWLAAAACGAEDTTRAVGAAQAGWVRAGAFGERGATLRGDLDRLMLQVILPARARILAGGADTGPAFALLTKQWSQFKTKWEAPAEEADAPVAGVTP